LHTNYIYKYDQLFAEEIKETVKKEKGW